MALNMCGDCDVLCEVEGVENLQKLSGVAMSYRVHMNVKVTKNYNISRCCNCGCGFGGR